VTTRVNNIQAMEARYQGFWKESMMVSLLDVVSWWSSHAFWKKVLLKTLIEVLWVPLSRPGILCLFVQIVFFIIRNKLTNFI